jgi:hypothetical protein
MIIRRVGQGIVLRDREAFVLPDIFIEVLKTGIEGTFSDLKLFLIV